MLVGAGTLSEHLASVRSGPANGVLASVPGAARAAAVTAARMERSRRSLEDQAENGPALGDAPRAAGIQAIRVQGGNKPPSCTSLLAGAQGGRVSGKIRRLDVHHCIADGSRGAVGGRSGAAVVAGRLWTVTAFGAFACKASASPGRGGCGTLPESTSAQHHGRSPPLCPSSPHSVKRPMRRRGGRRRCNMLLR